MNRLLQPIRQQLQGWFKSRRPRGREVSLSQRSTYIFPTVAGWFYLAICLVIFLVAVNYQNNLVHGAAFFLIAVGIMAIHYTYFNLAGLTLRVVRSYNCYVGERARFQINISRHHQRYCEGISCYWNEGDRAQIDLQKDLNGEFSLYLDAKRRGVLRPGALKIESVYPFGLLRVWSWLELEAEALVYPRPIEGRSPQISSGESEQGETGVAPGNDDFSSLQEYQPGVSTRHIAWKQYAQGRGLLMKSYLSQQDQQQWLSWDDWPELGREQKLSVICYWAKRMEHRSESYGLVIPGAKIKPDHGPAHLQRVLTALALFGSNHKQQVS